MERPTRRTHAVEQVVARHRQAAAFEERNRCPSACSWLMTTLPFWRRRHVSCRPIHRSRWLEPCARAPRRWNRSGSCVPNLVLMDLAMNGMSGLEATRHLKAQPDPPWVIILTLHDNLEYRAAAERARADGFVAKSEFGDELLPLIHHLLPGQTQPGGEELPCAWTNPAWSSS